MSKPRLRPPLITFQRVKVTLIILLIGWGLGTGDPRPFNASGVAAVPFFALASEWVRLNRWDGALPKTVLSGNSSSLIFDVGAAE